MAFYRQFTFAFLALALALGLCPWPCMSLGLALTPLALLTSLIRLYLVCAWLYWLQLYNTVHLSDAIYVHKHSVNRPLLVWSDHPPCVSRGFRVYLGNRLRYQSEICTDRKTDVFAPECRRKVRNVHGVSKKLCQLIFCPVYWSNMNRFQ